MRLRVLPLVLLLAVAAPVLAEDIFPNAKLNIQKGDKVEHVDAIIRYTADAFVVVQPKTRATLKTLPYAEVTSVEYSYSKSPRWKSGLLVSPFLFFSSGKKHWLMVQGKTDFAVLQLDKSNYKMIVAEIEVKTGKKVETVGENK